MRIKSSFSRKTRARYRIPTAVCVQVSTQTPSDLGKLGLSVLPCLPFLPVSILSLFCLQILGFLCFSMYVEVGYTTISKYYISYVIHED